MSSDETASTRRSGWQAFVAWYRRRPFIGGVLTVLGGLEMFFSGQLDVGHLHVQVGIEGFQSTLIPVVLVLLGVLAMLMPQHRIFYGVITLVVAVYSLVGVNLGGFFVGMILACVGGVITVSWAPRTPSPQPEEPPQDAGGAPNAEAEASETADSGIEALGLSSDVARSPEPADRRTGRRRRAMGGALAIALTISTATGLVGAQPQRAAAAEPSGVCLLGLIGDCSPSPAPSGTPSPSGSSTPAAPASPGAPVPGLRGLPGTSGSTPAPSGSTPAGPKLLAPQTASTVFSGVPALLQGSSLSFSGLRYVGLATITFADGRSAKVLELSMDSVTIPGFRLDNRNASGAGVDTVATSMAFTGGVTTYCASLKAVLDNGSSVQYDVSHPPSADGSVPVTRIISLEVFGITGGSSALTGFHEMIS